MRDDDFDRAIVEDNLGRARRRLTEWESSRDESHVGAAMAFDDGLNAAGYAAALGADDAEIAAHLATAARAAAVMFRTRGELVSSRTHLPSGDEEEFVDTSMTSPGTYVSALYAALASGEEEIAAGLAGLEPANYTSDQVESPGDLERFAPLLGQAVAGGNPEVPTGDDQYWAPQLEALGALVRRDAEGFRGALARVESALAHGSASPDSRNRPERYLELPVRGLEALRARRGVQ